MRRPARGMLPAPGQPCPAGPAGRGGRSRCSRVGADRAGPRAARRALVCHPACERPSGPAYPKRAGGESLRKREGPPRSSVSPYRRPPAPHAHPRGLGPGMGPGARFHKSGAGGRAMSLLQDTHKATYSQRVSLSSYVVSSDQPDLESLEQGSEAKRPRKGG